MPSCKNLFCFQSPRIRNIHDITEIVQESFENYILDIEDEIDEQMEPLHHTFEITLEEIEEAIRELHESDQ